VFHFTGDNIDSHVEGYIDGPVRIVRRNNAALRLGQLLSLSEIRSDQLFCPQFSQEPVNPSFGLLTEEAYLLLAAEYYG
jgi:hypothetical protein